MKLLIIEDKPETVKGIMDFAEDQDWVVEICDFDDASTRINSFDPEIIVMDWMLDAEDDDAGSPILEDIYKNDFRPTIVFSAVAGTIGLEEHIAKNPLIEIVPKGDEEVIIKKLKTWVPYIQVVKDLKAEYNNSLLVSVQAIGNLMKMDESVDIQVIKYMLNKRTTFYFDKEFDGELPPAWIQYDYPPVVEHLAVADVLRKNHKEIDIDSVGDATEYCVVLTPSCDMARASGTDRIIIAHCECGKSFSTHTTLGQKDKEGSPRRENKKQTLIKELHTGYNSYKFALPELPNKIPFMTINLKDIEQIELGKVALSENLVNDEAEYYRVASISSPFKEQIVWAHMLNSCRPGLPDRDFNGWAEGIFGLCMQ